MGEPAVELENTQKYITPESDLRFVTSLIENRNGVIKLVKPIKLQGTDATLISSKELNLEDIIKLRERKEQLIDLEFPISECIEIPDPVTYDKIKTQFDEIVKLLKKNIACDFSGIKYSCEEVISNLFNSKITRLHPLGISSLTLLSEQEKLFKYSISSAILSTKLQSLKSKTKLDSISEIKDSVDLFYVGLFQDIGKFFLNEISPFNSNKNDFHPLISAEILTYGQFSQEVISGVKSHEIFKNGFGFPKNKEIEPNGLAQIVQVANQFLINFNRKRGLEYTLGKLNSMVFSNSNINSNKPVLDEEIVKLLISLYPQINSQRFSFYTEFSYYESVYQMISNKIQKELKPNLAKVRDSPYFKNLDGNIRQLFEDYFVLVEDIGNYFNSQLTCWGKNVQNVKLESLKIKTSDEFYIKSQKLRDFGKQLKENTHLDYFARTASFIFLKFDEMAKRI